MQIELINKKGNTSGGTGGAVRDAANNALKGNYGDDYASQGSYINFQAKNGGLNNNGVSFDSSGNPIFNIADMQKQMDEGYQAALADPNSAFMQNVAAQRTEAMKDPNNLYNYVYNLSNENNWGDAERAQFFDAIESGQTPDYLGNVPDYATGYSNYANEMAYENLWASSGAEGVSPNKINKEAEKVFEELSKNVYGGDMSKVLESVNTWAQENGATPENVASVLGLIDRYYAEVGIQTNFADNRIPLSDEERQSEIASLQQFVDNYFNPEQLFQRLHEENPDKNILELQKMATDYVKTQTEDPNSEYNQAQRRLESLAAGGTGTGQQTNAQILDKAKTDKTTLETQMESYKTGELTDRIKAENPNATAVQISMLVEEAYQAELEDHTSDLYKAQQKIKELDGQIAKLTPMVKDEEFAEDVGHTNFETGFFNDNVNWDKFVMPATYFTTAFPEETNEIAKQVLVDEFGFSANNIDAMKVNDLIREMPTELMYAVNDYLDKHPEVRTSLESKMKSASPSAYQSYLSAYGKS